MKGKSKAAPELSKEFSVGGQRVELWFLPENKAAHSRIIELIDKAHSKLCVAMFMWTRQDFTQAVVRAQARGVHSECLIDRNAGRGAAKRVVKTLRESNIPIALNRGIPLLHHKFAYIDNKTLITGSANWTKSAFQYNDECFMILHNLSSAQQAVLNTVWKITTLESKEVHR
jgi:phosphatidylserine/phosphatidylglycerophosphate/cardiolipin synthase-like enzyme